MTDTPDSTTYSPRDRLLPRADEGSYAAAAALSRGQTRLAYELAVAAQGRLLYCREYGWLSWTGTHWAPDHAVAARNELLTLLRKLYATALDSDTLADVKASMSDSAQRGVLDIASNLPVFRVLLDELDADPYLLNVANGTFDLRTNELRPHDPEDRITRITRAAYDPAAPSPEWTEHLEYFQPNPEVRGFLQRFFGYSLLGKVVEHILLICYGPKGANGKGTTDRAIQYALGDYATAADQNLLIATRANSADSPSPARFALKGRRYVAMSETERRAPIAEALMKNLTGGDMIYARALKKDPVVFAPSHTLVLYTNHKPKLTADDSGVWRRVKLVPFDVSRPEEEWDTGIDQKLKLEADAILTWMLEGYAAWAEQGLATPAVVETATSTYQYEEDSVSQFIDTVLEAAPTERTFTRDIWDAWERFAHENQCVPILQKELYQRIENEGYARVRHATGALFKGLRIRQEAVTPSDDLTS